LKVLSLLVAIFGTLSSTALEIDVALLSVFSFSFLLSSVHEQYYIEIGHVSHGHGALSLLFYFVYVLFGLSAVSITI
jgi:hypothetical protein